MSPGMVPACRYAPVISIEAIEKEKMAARESTMRNMGNCAVNCAIQQLLSLSARITCLSPCSHAGREEIST